VRFEITKGYYLYRDKFRFAVEPVNVQLGTPVLPKGKEKNDPNFGQVEVYYQEAVIRLPVERNISGILPLTLNITSQGCADIGVCYPPQKQTVSLELPDPAVEPTTRPSVRDESSYIEQLLRNANLGWVVASFFGIGLLLTFTPCVFPMIPILSGIIVGTGREGHGVSHARGFALSLAYVLGMAVTYALIGVAAGLTGTLLTSALQNPWTLGSFALIFVVLSLSMFGFYELQLPSFLQSKVSEKTALLKGGSLHGTALMGALSALVVGPCVTAPLAGALLYIGQTGDVLLGGASLFSMALGMGVPLLMVGLSAGTLLPRSGAWLESVKKIFGVIMLANALWIVSPILSVTVQMIAWSLLLIVSAIFMHAIDPLPSRAKGWQRFWKGIGLVFLIIGAALLVGALSGAKDPLQPLSGLRGGLQSSEKPGVSFERIRTVAELDARIRSSERPVILDFYADWCVSCKEMDRYTFSDPRVKAKLSNWTLLQADVTANSDADKALLSRFNLFGPPGIIFFNAEGQEVDGIRVIGFQDADKFLKSLERIIP
jgi:thiol:disulfide interchange protein DsbD